MKNNKTKLMLVGLTLSLVLAGCNKNNKTASTTENTEISQSRESEDASKIKEDGTAIDSSKNSDTSVTTADKDKAEEFSLPTGLSVQEELNYVKKTTDKMNDSIDYKTMGGAEVRSIKFDMVDIWNVELEHIWQQLSSEKQSELKEEQDAWHEMVDANCTVIARPNAGGSCYSEVVNTWTMYYIIERSYYLADILVDEKGEDLTVPDDVQEIIDLLPDCDDLFEKIEGEWELEDGSGTMVISKSDSSDGSKWIINVPGLATLTDLDLYGYGGTGFIFNVKEDESDINYFWIYTFDLGDDKEISSFSIHKLKELNYPLEHNSIYVEKK